MHPVRQPDILDDQRIYIMRIQKTDVAERRIHFLLMKEGVHGHIHLYAMDMRIPDGLLHLFIIKVSRISAGAEHRSAQIYGITSALHGRVQRCHRAGRRQQFRLLHPIPCFPDHS